jgi:U3 small nucleolar RNA-associated protein 3
MKVYIAYLTYYALLKSKNKLNDHHPIIAKLIYLKSLIDKSKPIDDKIMPELVSVFEEDEEEEVEEHEDESDEESLEKNDQIIKANENKIKRSINKEEDYESIEEEEQEEEENESVGEITKRNTLTNGKKQNNNLLGRKKKTDDLLDDNDDIEDEFYKENVEKLNKAKEKLKEKNKKKDDKLKAEIAEKERLGQRVANENIIKSRGLYRKRKKYQGNAKLHLREKFFKKMNKRKNYVKEYSGKPLNYGGEATGIRDDLIRGTKLH